jgi:hypothetical protein
VNKKSIRTVLAVSVVAGVAGGVLTLVAGADPATAVIAAGGGFAATARLGIKVIELGRRPNGKK